MELGTDNLKLPTSHNLALAYRKKYTCRKREIEDVGIEIFYDSERS